MKELINSSNEESQESHEKSKEDSVDDSSTDQVSFNIPNGATDYLNRQALSGISEKSEEDSRFDSKIHTDSLIKNSNHPSTIKSN